MLKLLLWSSNAIYLPLKNLNDVIQVSTATEKYSRDIVCRKPLYRVSTTALTTMISGNGVAAAFDSSGCIKHLQDHTAQSVFQQRQTAGK